jgi:hypothetical protein
MQDLIAALNVIRTPAECRQGDRLSRDLLLIDAIVRITPIERQADFPTGRVIGASAPSPMIFTCG